MAGFWDIKKYIHIKINKKNYLIFIDTKYIFRLANGICIPKSCDLQLTDSLSLFYQLTRRAFGPLGFHRYVHEARIAQATANCTKANDGAVETDLTTYESNAQLIDNLNRNWHTCLWNA